MDVATIAASKLISHTLRSWVLSPRKIGRHSFQGHCVVAEAMHVNYQQQSTVQGSSGGVFGLSNKGTGFVTGGGGFIGTTHKGVVTIVFQDEGGSEQTHELPAGIAARTGTVVRLDMINRLVVGATNLSGKGQFLHLMDATSFIAMPRMATLEILLAVVALALLGNGIHGSPSLIGWGLIAAIAPALKLWRIIAAHRERKELVGYIGEVSA